MKTATYLLIKSSIMSVTDAIKPEPILENEPLFYQRMKPFLDSFIEIDNPQMLWDMQNDDGYYLYDKEGLFPAPEGIQFKFKNQWRHNSYTPWHDGQLSDGDQNLETRTVAVLTPLKQSGEPGNEAKKEDVFTLDQVLDIMAAYAVCPSDYTVEETRSEFPHQFKGKREHAEKWLNKNFH